MFSIIFANLLLSVLLLQSGSMSSTANRRFIVCINRSTILVPLWYPAGAIISFMFLF